MKVPVNVIIFDFDGVIVDSGADIASAVQYAQKYFNKTVLPKDEIISYVGRGVENLIRRSFKDCNDELIKQIIPVYRNYYLENCIVETALYKNLKQTLEYFQDKKLAVVTNKPEDLTLKILEGLKVREYFQLVVGPESVSKMKPDPEGLVKVLDRFGEPAYKAVMIGDSHTDIEAGRSAGTNTCGVTYGLGDTEELLKASPDFVLDDILKLTEVIE